VCNAAYGRHRRPDASIEIPLDEVLPAFDEGGRHASLCRDWSSSVDDPAVQKQLRGVLASAIDELPPHYRAAIVLRDVEGLSTAEVADALGIPVPTAKTRAHRARLRLRKRLSTFMETEVPTRPSES
jgi:RNA polymerase sigma-70 factor (ECF subfamily)